MKHKGQAIYVIDFSHCSGKEILVLLDLVRADIARHAPGSVLTLADFTGAQIDKQVADEGEGGSGARSSVCEEIGVGRDRESAARVLRKFQELLAAGTAYI